MSPLCQQTPVDWYSKKQAIVETATYGSEFVAAKTATEQIMDIRQTLRYFGTPIRLSPAKCSISISNPISTPAGDFFSNYFSIISLSAISNSIRA